MMQPIGEMASHYLSDKCLRRGLIPKYTYVRTKIKRPGTWKGLEEEKGRRK